MGDARRCYEIVITLNSAEFWEGSIQEEYSGKIYNQQGSSYDALLRVVVGNISFDKAVGLFKVVSDRIHRDAQYICNIII